MFSMFSSKNKKIKNENLVEELVDHYVSFIGIKKNLLFSVIVVCQIFYPFIEPYEGNNEKVDEFILRLLSKIYPF